MSLPNSRNISSEPTNNATIMLVLQFVWVSMMLGLGTKMLPTVVPMDRY